LTRAEVGKSAENQAPTIIDMDQCCVKKWVNPTRKSTDGGHGEYRLGRNERHSVNVFNRRSRDIVYEQDFKVSPTCSVASNGAIEHLAEATPAASHAESPALSAAVLLTTRHGIA
jgi:hypothetical protein